MATPNNYYEFHVGTQAEYNSAKTANTLKDNDLYFTTDTLLLYIGKNQYCAGVEVVTEFPETMAENKLYINRTTLEGKIYNGTEIVTVHPKVSNVYDSADNGDILTKSAISTFVSQQITNNEYIKDVRATSSIALNVDGTTLKANIKISPKDGNNLVIQDDNSGLYSATVWKTI